MNIRTDRILDVSNAFQNKNAPIQKLVCVIAPHYYLDWFEKYYPNVTLNRYGGPFCLQCMNGIQEKKQPDKNGINYLMQWLKF